MEQPVWQFQTNSGFSTFQAEHAAEIEKAYQNHDSCMKIRIGNQNYTIDFDAMIQTNDSSNKARFLRRRGVNGETDARCIEWQWKDHKHNNDWKAYSVDESKEIEKHFHADDLTMTIQIAVSAHDTKQFKIHFGEMTQQAQDQKKKTREIRRVAKIVHRPGAALQTHDATEEMHEAGRRARSPDRQAKVAAGACTTKDWVKIGGDTCHFLYAQKKGTAKLDKTIKIAGFDMDDTLVMPKSGKVFAQSAQDWKWIAPQVVPKLQGLAAEGYVIAIFSNQSGVKNDPAKGPQLHEKIVSLNAAVGVPIWAVFATHEDKYRKPSSCMWDLFCDELKKSFGVQNVDLKSSFYCGDAAGRTRRAGWATMAGRDKDFSCSDRKFAHNVGITFMTPEQWLLGQAPPSDKTWEWGESGGPEELKEFLGRKALSPEAYKIKDNKKNEKAKQEMLIMCGFPGSGKSTFFRTYCEPAGYEWINRDTLKTPAKCQKAAETALAAGKSVVIDNTNPDPASREPYLDLAKKYKVPARAMHLQTSLSQAKALATFRECFCDGPHIPGIAHNIFKSKFEKPSAKEGFTEVMDVKLAPEMSFFSEEQKKFFSQLV